MGYDFRCILGECHDNSFSSQLTVDELRSQDRQLTDPIARTHWQIIWLLAQGISSARLAGATG
jgi:hypothetical protein